MEQCWAAASVWLRHQWTHPSRMVRQLLSVGQGTREACGDQTCSRDHCAHMQLSHGRGSPRSRSYGYWLVLKWIPHIRGDGVSGPHQQYWETWAPDFVFPNRLFHLKKGDTIICYLISRWYATEPQIGCLYLLGLTNVHMSMQTVYNRIIHA